MNSVKHIEIDLNTYRIVLQFQNAKAPLILHFDTPSRKFYLALIALIVHENNKQDRPGYVYIRKHEKLLKFMDDTLAGSYASGTTDGMWEKIRKAWHYSLPNLEEAAHFKLQGRDHVSPYEKGGKYLYECTENECDLWASLFGIDAITNKWRFRFAFDAAGLGLNDVTLKYEDQQNGYAWDAFLKDLEKTSTRNLSDTRSELIKSAVRTQPIHWRLLAVSVGILITLSVSGTAILNRYLRPVPPPAESVAITKPSIAVLPFVNISDNPEHDYFCDGVTEELINSLARVKDLRVISRTSVFYYKGKDCDLRTIGENLNVETVLEGSVRVSGNKLRISAQLINAVDDSHLWSETYDRELKDIFALQEDLTMKILTAIHLKLTGDRLYRVLAKGTKNIDAFLKYLQGVYFQKQWTRDSNVHAEQLHLEAIESDPGYASPYITLAFLHLNKRTIGLTDSPVDDLKQAFTWAKKGISVDPENGEGFLALGRAYQQDGQLGKAEEAYRHCIELIPNYARAYFRLGRISVLTMQYEKAISLFNKAIELDPLIHPRGLPPVYILMGKYKEAISELNISLSRYPKHSLLLYQSAAAYAGMNNKEKAQAYASKLLKINPKFSVSKWSKPRRRTWNPVELEKFSALLRKAGLPD